MLSGGIEMEHLCEMCLFLTLLSSGFIQLPVCKVNDRNVLRKTWVFIFKPLKFDAPNYIETMIINIALNPF